MLRQIINDQTKSRANSSTPLKYGMLEKGKSENLDRLIVILDNAQLETAKVGKEYKLLNCDDHKQYLEKFGRDPALYRPDICHQVSIRKRGAWSASSALDEFQKKKKKNARNARNAKNVIPPTRTFS